MSKASSSTQSPDIKEKRVTHTGNDLKAATSKRRHQHLHIEQSPIAVDIAAQLFCAWQGKDLTPEETASVVLNLTQHRLQAAPSQEPMMLEALIEQAEQQDEEEITTLSKVILSLQGEGKSVQAEALARQVVETFRARHGSNAEITLRSMNVLACLLHQQGRLIEARRMYLQIAEAQRRLLGVHHVQTVTTLENLAMLLVESNELQHAETLLQESLSHRSRQLGPYHRDTLRSRYNQGLLWRRQGLLPAAKALIQEVWQLQMLHLPIDDPDTLSSEYQLGLLCELSNQWSSAEQHYRSCLLKRVVVLGSSHRDALQVRGQLAGLLLLTDRLNEAKQLLQIPLEQAMVTWADEDVLIASLRLILGKILLGLGELESAEPHLLASYQGLKQQLGMTHGRTQRVCRAVIELYRVWNKMEKAAPFQAATANCS